MVQCYRCMSERCVKAGFMQGQQRYKCNDCGYYFIDKPRRGMAPLLRMIAVWLHFAGLPQRRIAKFFGVSPVAVLKWVDAVGRERDNYAMLPGFHASLLPYQTDLSKIQCKKRKTKKQGRLILVLDSPSLHEDVLVHVQPNGKIRTQQAENEQKDEDGFDEEADDLS